MPTIDLTSDLKRWCVWVVERAMQKAGNLEGAQAMEAIRRVLACEADESELRSITDTNPQDSLGIALKLLAHIDNLDDMLEAAQIARDTVLEADPGVDRELVRVLRGFADALEKTIPEA